MTIGSIYEIVCDTQAIMEGLGHRVGWTSEICLPPVRPVRVESAQAFFEARWGVTPGSYELDLGQLPAPAIGRYRKFDDGRAVITIAQGLEQYPRQFHLTFAHEMSHMQLDRAGIDSAHGLNRKERMAELCLILAGLGADLLNTEIQDRPPSYLERDELASAYLVFQAMHDRKPNFAALNGPAGVAVRKVMQRYPDLSDGRLHDEQLFRGMIDRGMSAAIRHRRPDRDPTAELCSLERRFQARAETQCQPLRFLQAILLLQDLEDLISWTLDFRSAA